MTLSQIEQLKTIAFEVFQWLSLVGNHKDSVNQAKIERLFSPDLKIYRNGNPTVVGHQKLYERLSDIQSKVHNMKFSIKEMLTSEDKVVIRYQVTIIDRLERSHDIFAFAILQIQEDRVVNWWEVMHEQGIPSNFIMD